MGIDKGDGGGGGQSKKNATNGRSVERRIQDKEQSILENKKETGIALDEEGKELFRLQGTDVQLQLSPEQLDKVKGAIFVHNHPEGGGLSDQDIIFALNRNIKELRAVGKEQYKSRRGQVDRTARYSIKPQIDQKKLARAASSQKKMWPSLVREMIQKAETSVIDNTFKKIKSGKMTHNEANARHYHNVIKKVSPQLKKVGIDLNYKVQTI